MINNLIETDTVIREFVQQPLGESLDIVDTSAFKYTLMSVLSLTGRIDFISESILTLLDRGHIYASKILLRSIIEHFLRFQYIFTRWAVDKSDSVGEEYMKYCSLNEEVDLAAAYKRQGTMIGAQVSESPFEIIKQIHPEFASLTNDELNQKVTQFSYKKIIDYVALHLFKTDFSSSEAFLPNLLPHYSDLSSFVHGGPMADRTMVQFLKENDIENKTEEMAELTVSISSSSKLFALIMVANIDSRFIEPMVKYRKLLHTYKLPGGAP